MQKISSSMRAKEKFLTMLHEGVFKPGDRLPSEPQMAQMISVSRETWRSSLEQLRREHYIASRHGVGSFVLDLPKKIPNDLSSLRSLSEMIRQNGIQEQDSSVQVARRKAEKKVQQKLDLEKDTIVTIITRTRFSANTVICYSINYIPIEYSKELSSGNLPPSLFHYFEEKYALYIARSDTQIVVPTKEDANADRLFLNGANSVLALYQLHYDAKGRPIMYSMDYLNGDQFDFSVTRIRPH